MVHVSGSVHFVFRGLPFSPTLKDSSLLAGAALFPYFLLLYSILVHERPAILFIHLPMGRHLNCFYIVS